MIGKQIIFVEARLCELGTFIHFYLGFFCVKAIHNTKLKKLKVPESHKRR